MGTKNDDGKDRWHLLPWLATQKAVRVMGFGARKYSDHGWRDQDNAKILYWDAALRHMLAHAFGERLDPESGEPHLAHAICCLMIALETELLSPKPDADVP